MKRPPRRSGLFPRLLLQVEQLEGRELLDAGLPHAALPQGPPPPSSAGDELQIQAVPSDPSFGSQWNLNNTGQNGGVVDADIDAPEAWDVTQGNLRTVVAVIDTGVDYRHRDLYRNIWINQGEIPAEIRSRLLDADGDTLITFWDLNDARNQGDGKARDLNGNLRIDAGDILRPIAEGGWANGISDDGDGFVDDLIGWDFVNNDNDPLDDNDHGTHVAGIIGATGQDGHGIAGINWKVSMMAIKTITESGTGAAPTALAGLRYAIDHGATISNNSYGGGDYYQDMYAALDAARAQGHIFVVSAGNGGEDFSGDNLDVIPEYPAAYNLRNVVAVAATTRNDARYAPSNYGVTTVDLGAPGREILSSVRDDGYAGFSGTSMAAPHVTGVLALVRSQKPKWFYYQVLDQVLGTVDPVAALAGRTATGGRVNAFRAVSEVRTDRQGPVVVSFTPNATGARPVSSVRVTFSEGILLSTFTRDDIRSFTGPNGPLTVTRIEPVYNSDHRSFDVFFAEQVTSGVYRMELGADIRDLASNRMDQDGDGVTGEWTQDRFTGTFTIQPVFTFTNATRTTIRDFATTTSTLVIDQDITIADLNVRLDIRHTFDNDLHIRLRGPDGTEVVLVNRRGGSGDNFSNTVLDDEAALTLWNGRAPFAGSFRPEAGLSALDGKNARGTWQLIIEDRQRADAGTLNSWSLIIENGGSLPPAPAPAPGAVTTAGMRITSVDDLGQGASSSGLAGAFADEGRGTAILPLSLADSERPGSTQEVTTPSVGLPRSVRLPESFVDLVLTVERDEPILWSLAVQPDAPPALEDLLTFFARSQ